MLSPRALVLSAGTGPSPARVFLDLLFVELEAECLLLGIRIHGRSPPGRRGQSSTLAVSGPLHLLQPWLGTHALLAPRCGQSRSARKRWHVSVGFGSVISSPQQRELDLREVQIRATRSGGPGGQHVNKTESAIQAVHLPTGVRVIARERRSRHQNQARALKRLSSELQRLGEVETELQRHQAHTLRRALVRGNAICVWRLDRRGGLCRLMNRDGRAATSRT